MDSVWLRNPHVWNPSAPTEIEAGKETPMLKHHWLILAFAALPLLNACAPAVGAGAAIAADQIYEEETGDDLF
jgi:hypothetical protein